MTLLGACSSMAPVYRRPDQPIAEHWRDGDADATGGDRAIANLAWQELLRDERLRQVVALAIGNNRDLRMALLNIEKARARYRIQGAELFPSVEAEIAASAARGPASLNSDGRATVRREYTTSVGFASYELDLFGRVRSLKNEAKEAFLAMTYAQRSTRLSLIAEVTGTWLTLAADFRHLALAQKTLESQRETLKLTEYQRRQGTVSGLDLAHVQTSVASARADVAAYTAQLKQDVNALELMVGAPVPDSLLPDSMQDAPVVLAALPLDLDSLVLLARPDVMAAEHTLKAANANIGAARAAFFPNISLTAAAGRGSDALSSLFGGDNRSWSFAPTLSVPIFNAGRLRAEFKVSKVERDIAVAGYEKTIQIAFREVADALAVRTTLQERLSAQQALVAAAARSYELADARYRSGIDSYLDALVSLRSLYGAQQDLIALELAEQNNRVTLYKVLGGDAALSRQR